MAAVRVARGQPVAHFFGGFIGKREGEDRGGGGSVVQQVLDATDERARLSGARPGIDQQRTAAPGCRFKLARIQRVARAGPGGRRGFQWWQEQCADGLIQDEARGHANVFGDVRGFAPMG